VAGVEPKASPQCFEVRGLATLDPGASPSGICATARSTSYRVKWVSMDNGSGDSHL
jgi:hypothetical protein